MGRLKDWLKEDVELPFSRKKKQETAGGASQMNADAVSPASDDAAKFQEEFKLLVKKCIDWLYIDGKLQKGRAAAVAFGALTLVGALSPAKAPKPTNECGSLTNSDIQSAVQLFAYRCDWVDYCSIRGFSSKYFQVGCNGYRYQYSIKDYGGRIAVELN